MFHLCHFFCGLPLFCPRMQKFWLGISILAGFVWPSLKQFQTIHKIFILDKFSELLKYNFLLLLEKKRDREEEREMKQEGEGKKERETEKSFCFTTKISNMTRHLKLGANKGNPGPPCGQQESIHMNHHCGYPRSASTGSWEVGRWSWGCSPGTSQLHS